MANSPPLVPEFSQGTKCDRDVRLKSRVYSAKPLRAPVLLLVILLPLFFIKAVASLEIDSDLVFDDGAANSEYVSHADHRKSSSNVRRHSNTSLHLKGTNIYHEPSTSDHQIVAPVESPVEDAEEAKPDSSKGIDTSFFGRISAFGKRAKRQWTFNLFGNDEEPEENDSLTTTEGKGFLGLDSGDLFGWFSSSDRRDEKYESSTSEVASSTSTSEPESGETPQVTVPHDGRYRIKRSTMQDDVTGEVSTDELNAGDEESDASNGADVENATNEVQSEDNDESNLDAAAAHRPGQLQHLSPDDEDYIGEAASGSGMDSRTALPTLAALPIDRQPRFYRITFTILEPFREEYYNRNSEAFQQLSQNLSQAVNELYESVAGRQSATVIQIQETSERFSSLVTLDLGTLDNYNENQLRERLYRQIADYRRLGNIAAEEENFNFRSFGGSPPPQCQPNETVCRSGECLPQETRCDGKRDCKDGSDEYGCIPTSTYPTTTAPGGLPRTIDRCRADDKVRCADGTVFICNVQLCDGKPDCPGGDDEANCPIETECAEGEFICDLTRCILGSRRCDGHPDCSDGTDEQDCPPPPVVCQPDEWKCDYGPCIERRLRCNGRQDCPRDNSDERNCPCKEDEFTCANKYCIPKKNRCDGFNNCQDGSDERNCRECGVDEFQCNDKTCISSAKRCDRHTYDCPDGSDEENCMGLTACREDQFRCNDGVCLNINQRCNFIDECVTGEDEKGCTRCTPAEFRCKDGSCVDLSAHCNGHRECSDGSDEDDCGMNCVLLLIICSVFVATLARQNYE